MYMFKIIKIYVSEHSSALYESLSWWLKTNLDSAKILKQNTDLFESHTCF